jgi:hypothetical protein
MRRVLAQHRVLAQQRISSARRGAASEITAARHDHLAGRLLGAIADLGFTGLDPDPDDPVITEGWPARTRRPAAAPAVPYVPGRVRIGMPYLKFLDVPEQ